MTRRQPRWRVGQGLGRCWSHVVELGLVLWVVRVPVAFTVLGLLVLCKAPQAYDLFVELASTPSERVGALSYGRVLAFLVLLVFVWAMPTHYAARLLLATDRRFRLQADTGTSGCLRAMERFVPRLLGLLTFAAVLVGIRRSNENLPTFQLAGDAAVMETISTNLMILAGLVVLAGLLFAAYMAQRRKLARSGLVRAAKALASLTAPLLRRIAPKQSPAGDAEEQAQRNLGQAMLLLVFGVFAFVLVVGPSWVAETFPRALAVPLVLGGWLPLLAYLSAVGRSIRVPIILGAVVGTAALAVLLGDNHSVRRIAAAPGHHPAFRLTLDAAVDLWKHENDCANKPAQCPRPIIVAAAGGASRAGFFTASILGYLLQEAPYHGLTSDGVRRRLFAISSVSGSSLGAVMSVAALAERPGDTAHACVSTPVELWWGRTIGNWRDCFEALTSGDFLTPVFIGLSFHDLIWFPRWREWFPWWPDRAALLEESWERRYQEVIGQPKVEHGCVGLQCPFLTLRPRKGAWVPLLVLNGTSETGGNRLITSVLAPSYGLKDLSNCPTANRRSDRQDCRLFAQGTDFHDLLQDDTDPSDWNARLQAFLHAQSGARNDVSISTAAHNSARFPLVSPSGNVRNVKHQVIDRILDGGYFENYGALTAMELARAIRAVDPNLRPFVLVISNDPDDPLDPEDDDAPPPRGEQPAPIRQQQTRKPTPTETRRNVRDAADGVWFADLLTPLTTFAHTRSARGALAVAQLRNALYGEMQDCAFHVVHVRVWPQQQQSQPSEQQPPSRAVSMSWWLSPPIQRRLHQQTEGRNGPLSDGKNGHENGSRLVTLWQILRVPSCLSQQPEAAGDAP